MRTLYRSLIALFALATGLPAQNLSTMARGTAITGINDSAVVMACDSVRPTCRTRAVTTNELFKRPRGTTSNPSYTFALDSTTGLNYDGTSLTLLRAGNIGVRVMNNQTDVMANGSNAITVSGATSRISLGMPMTFTAGSAANPSINFINDTDNGIYAGTDSVQFTTGGTRRGFFHSGGLNVTNLTVSGTCTGCGGASFPLEATSSGTASLPTYTWDGDENTGMYRRGADTLAFTMGGVDTALFMTYNDVGNQNVGGLTFRTKASRPYHFYSGSTQGPSFVDAQVRTSTGNESTPTYSYRDGINSGMWLKDASASDTLVFSANGTRSLALTNSSTTTGKLFGGTQSLEINGGTGTSTNILLRTTTSGGSATDALSINDAQQLATQWGTAALPRYTFISDLNTGMFRNGTDQLGFSTAGLLGMRINELQSTLIDTGTAIGTARRGLGFLGDSTKGISWSPGNNTMYIVVGTQAGDAVQIRDAGTNAVQVFGGAQSAARNSPTFTWSNFSTSGLGHTPGGDTVVVMTGATVRMLVADMAATAAGDVALCISTGDVVRKGATCGSSSSKVKTGISTLSGNLALALRPVSFTYKKGFYNQRREFGLIAEEAAKVDPRFAFYAERDETLPDGSVIKKGDAFNVNDRAVQAAMLATLQMMQQQIDSLKAEVAALKRSR